MARFKTTEILKIMPCVIRYCLFHAIRKRKVDPPGVSDFQNYRKTFAWKEDHHLSIKNHPEGPTCEAEGIIVAFGLLRIGKGAPRHGMARGQAAHGIKNGAEGAERLGVPNFKNTLAGRGHISHRPPGTQQKHHF